jgi:Right handed beta helix region
MQGNYIGTDPTGHTAVPNTTGIEFENGEHEDLIADNVIASTAAGIAATLNAHRDVVSGNRIGVGVGGEALSIGTLSCSGGCFGISIRYSNRVTVTANEIAFVQGDAVDVFYDPGSGSGVGDTIEDNGIHDNTGLGIDLVAGPGSPGGITPNDPGDADVGANHLQNFPILSNGPLGLTATLDSGPGHTYNLRIFQADSCAQPRQGRTLAYSSTIATDQQGSAVDVPGSVQGQFLTATVTDVTPNSPAFGDTSEFSPCFTVP